MKQEAQVKQLSDQIPYPENQCIHQLFEAQVKRTPDAVALVFEGQEMTYRELNALSNQFAHYLKKLRVKNLRGKKSSVAPEVPVGICMDRSLEMIVGLLGVLKAGGAYLPLDPTYPPERLTFLLQNTHTSLLVTHTRLLAELSPYAEHVVGLDTTWETIAQESTADVVSDVAAHNLTYIIYTSGSTGKPKGVQVTHQNIVHSTFARMLYYGPVDSILLLSPFIFDVGTGVIFWALCQGSKLVLPRAGAELELSYLAELIAHHRISHMTWATFLYRLLLEQAPTHDLTSLRTVSVGGEACPRDLVERHYELLPQVPLFNEYGPTEATVWCSVYPCQPGYQHAIMPIGRPVPNTQIYLLDAHLQPVAPGEPGELYVGGNGLARGYLGEPEMTASRFIPDPFSDQSGNRSENKTENRLYKTGDLARYLPTGDIEFLGRDDQQVKIRGFRVEPGEVEAVLKQLPAVHQAAVTAQELTPGDKRLVAYLVPAQGEALIASHIRSALTEKLPEYMRPSSIVLLETIPLSATGKIDYHALPMPDTTNMLQNVTLEPETLPTTPTEERLAEIMAELLRLEQVGIDDDFFQLGGHSLLAAKFIAQVAEMFEVDLALRTLFETPTVRHLAREIERLIIARLENMSEDEALQLLESQFTL
jgi:amino acid adenylation domain-containing protein